MPCETRPMNAHPFDRPDVPSRWLDRIRAATHATPWTLLLSAAAILAAMSPAAMSLLEFARLAVAEGEIWRLLTGHLTHFGADHLLWDVAMFAALGGVCEHRWPRRTRITLVTSALAISLAIVPLAPEIDTYRGLSGLDSALFGLLATSLLRESDAQRGRLFTAALCLFLTGFVAKIGYELITGTTFFVDSTAAGFVPVPLAHAVGFVVGASIAAMSGRQPIGTPRSVSYDI